MTSLLDDPRARYEAYIASTEWRLVRAHYRSAWWLVQCCPVCSASEDLHMHHLTYARFGRERLTDLLPLCGDCHEGLHAGQLGGAALARIERARQRNLTARKVEPAESEPPLSEAEQRRLARAARPVQKVRSTHVMRHGKWQRRGD